MTNGGIMGGLADGQRDEMGRQMYGLGKNLLRKQQEQLRRLQSHQ